MKNTLILAACSSLFLLSSCDKKSYTCRCDGGFSGGGTTETIQTTTKSRAERKCDAFNSGPDTNDGFYNCRLQ